MSKHFVRLKFVLLIVVGLFLFQSADHTSHAYQGDGKLSVVVTTTILGDVVREIAGNLVDLTVLVPLGADVHGFEPVPQELALLTEADLVFVNGINFEEELFAAIDGIVDDINMVVISEGISLREFAEGEDIHGHGDEEDSHGDEDGDSHDDEEDSHSDEDSHGDEDSDSHGDEEDSHGDEDVHGHGDEDAHDHGDGADPHVWMNPMNVRVWANNIAQVLSNADPNNANIYAANAELYQSVLFALDQWITSQVESIPLENRELVTDHDVWGYFADRYGFQLVGTVLPSFSSVGEPSAQEVAEVVNAIREFDAKAIFVGTTANLANSRLAQQVAEETGIQLVDVLTGSLGDAERGGETYIHYMRYNVTRVVNALK